MLELVIVVVIIGIIAAIAIPRFSRASQTSAFNATQSSWITFEKQMFIYQATYNEFPPSMTAGTCDSGFRTFIRAENWLAPTPMGGSWVWYNNVAGVTGIGIEQSPAPALWLQFDRMFDDGDLNAGLLQVKGTAFTRIISDSGPQVVPGDLVTPVELP